MIRHLNPYGQTGNAHLPQAPVRCQKTLICYPKPYCQVAVPTCCRPQSRRAMSPPSVSATSVPGASAFASRTLCETANVAASTMPCHAPTQHN